MRIYVPATLDELPSDPVGGRHAHGVTAALRAALPGEDEDGWEYAALLSAADDALRLLAERPLAPRLRVVLAADLPDALVEGGGAGARTAASAVELLCDVPWPAVVSLHADEPAARADVEAALAGDEDAEERLVERELLWYDVTEVTHIPR